jgi:hypothetical protein
MTAQLSTLEYKIDIDTVKLPTRLNRKALRRYSHM